MNHLGVFLGESFWPFINAPEEVSQTDPRMDAERMGAVKNRMAPGIERDHSILGFDDGILPAIISRLDFLDSSPLILHRRRQGGDV